MSRPTIIVLSSSLLTDRMLRHGEALVHLAREHRVQIWSTADTPASNADLPVGVTIEPFPSDRDFPFAVELIRRLNDCAWIRRRRPPSRVDQYAYRLRQEPAGWMRAMAALVDLIGLQSWLERLAGRLMVRAARSTDAFARVSAEKPVAVVSMSPHWSVESVVCAAALGQGIPTFAFVTSFDNLSTKRRVELTFTGWMVWSAAQRAELLSYHPTVRSADVAVVGAPQFDVFHDESACLGRDEWCEGLGLDPSLPVVVYALGSPNLIDEAPGAFEFLRRVDKGELGLLQVVLRAHPVHDHGRLRGDLEEWSGASRYPVVIQETGAVLPVNQRRQDREAIVDWVSTFCNADVIINLSSTVTIDACVANTPVISLDFDPSLGGALDGLVKSINRTWPHFAPVVATGGVRMVGDHDELIDATRSYLGDPALDGDGRRKIVELVCGFSDGHCGKRLALQAEKWLREFREDGGIDMQ